VRAPRLSGVRQERAQVLVRALVRGPGRVVWIAVVVDAEVVARFRPDVVRFRRMNVRVVAAGGGEHIVVRGRVGNILTDVAGRAGDEGVEIRRVRVLVDLLLAAPALLHGL